MFTPQPYAGYVGTPRRTDNGAGGQVPSAGGSSFLFPQSATAPRTSPGFGPSTPTQGNTPFGMPTPGVPLPSGMQPGMQGHQFPTGQPIPGPNPQAMPKKQVPVRLCAKFMKPSDARNVRVIAKPAAKSLSVTP